MPVPTYDQFIAPLLRVLAEHPEGLLASNAHEAVADRLNLTPADREERLPSGAQAVFRNRNGWAHDRLKRAKLSFSPRMGFWKLTEEGLAFASKHPQLSEEEVEKLASVDRSNVLKPKPNAGPAESAPTKQAVLPSEITSPEERIDSAMSEIRESVSRDLLEQIGRAPPEFFEHLVLDLLHALGYGTSRADLKRVGGSGDQGIDGIIFLDKLGLEKVYIQAKRWKNKVSSPEIQGFMGALQLQGASKGVFLTTSEFTKDALQAAQKASGKIVLVDGDELARLMMDNGVGVTRKPLYVPRVDNDYFEDA